MSIRFLMHTLCFIAIYVTETELAEIDPLCAVCPGEKCTYEKSLSCSCTSSVKSSIEIPATLDREYTSVSLGIVIDDTGSMSGVIYSVRITIQNVVMATATVFDKYVLATYNDPYVYNLIESTKSDDIVQFVNKIKAEGGGDCPEMALTGLRDVAARVTQGSAIFLFTDASSKDLELESSVRDLLLAKDIRVNVVVVGDLCTGLGSELYRLSNVTHGHVYYTPSQYDVRYVMNYIAKYAKYGVRFIRGMPASLDDLKVLVNVECTCTTHVVRNFACVPVPKSSKPAGTTKSSPNNWPRNRQLATPAVISAATPAAVTSSATTTSSPKKKHGNPIVWYLIALCIALLLLLILFILLYYGLYLRQRNSKQ